VYRGGAPDRPGVRIFDGELSFTSPQLVVGCYHADQLVTVDVGRVGRIPITIYVDPPAAPARVVVVVS
jgi:hypothetical protein